MDAWIYRGGKAVRDARRQPVRLEYYLHREIRDLNTGTCIYGIRVELYRERNGHVCCEARTTPALSYSGAQVDALIEKLRRGAVTPTGLLEVVDDEISTWV